MPRSNLIFAIFTPLVLMVIIAAIVVVVGETLLAMHHWAHHAALYPVSIALGISALALVGGIIASAIAPQPKSSGSTH
jgi:uncharacterized protein (DUF983 family)